MIATSIPVAEALRQIEAEKDRVLTEGAASTHPEIWTVNGGMANGLEKAAGIVRSLAALSQPPAAPEVTTAMVSAAACSVARDDEGEFPPLMDLIGFSGENKTHTVLWQALRDALAAAPPATSAWRPIADVTPVPGKRCIGCWEAFSDVSEHVEMAVWRAEKGWCNTYGHPFSGAPTHIMDLPAPPPGAEKARRDAQEGGL